MKGAIKILTFGIFLSVFFAFLFSQMLVSASTVSTTGIKITKAESSGLSYFAITGEKLAAAPLEKAA